MTDSPLEQQSCLVAEERTSAIKTQRSVSSTSSTQELERSAQHQKYSTIGNSPCFLASPAPPSASEQRSTTTHSSSDAANDHDDASSPSPLDDEDSSNRSEEMPCHQEAIPLTQLEDCNHGPGVVGPPPNHNTQGNKAPPLVVGDDVDDALRPSRFLYVNGVPDGTTDAELAAIFTPHARVRYAKVMVDLKTLRTRNHGFVFCETAVEADDARRAVNGQQVTIGDGTSSSSVSLSVTFSERDMSFLDNPTQLYVRKVPHSVDANRQLRALCEPFGEIVSIEAGRTKKDPKSQTVVLTFKEAGRPAEECEAFLHRNTHTFSNGVTATLLAKRADDAKGPNPSSCSSPTSKKVLSPVFSPTPQRFTGPTAQPVTPSQARQRVPSEPLLSAQPPPSLMTCERQKRRVQHKPRSIRLSGAPRFEPPRHIQRQAAADGPPPTTIQPRNQQTSRAVQPPTHDPALLQSLQQMLHDQQRQLNQLMLMNHAMARGMILASPQPTTALTPPWLLTVPPMPSVQPPAQ